MAPSEAKFTLIVSGDIEQAVLAFHEREIEATIAKAYYDQGGHQTALQITSRLAGSDYTLDTTKLREQLEQWKAERGTTGMLLHYGNW